MGNSNENGDRDSFFMLFHSKVVRNNWLFINV